MSVWKDEIQRATADQHFRVELFYGANRSREVTNRHLETETEIELELEIETYHTEREKTERQTIFHLLFSQYSHFIFFFLSCRLAHLTTAM